MSCWIILYLLFCNNGRTGFRQGCVNTTDDCGCHNHGCVDTTDDCGCNTNNNCIQPRNDGWCDSKRDYNGDCNSNRESDCDCDRRYDNRDYKRDKDWGYDREWNRDRDSDCDCDRPSYRDKN